jgi:hypothetical protein
LRSEPPFQLSQILCGFEERILPLLGRREPVENQPLAQTIGL